MMTLPVFPRETPATRTHAFGEAAPLEADDGKPSPSDVADSLASIVDSPSSPDAAGASTSDRVVAAPRSADIVGSQDVIDDPGSEPTLLESKDVLPQIGAEESDPTLAPAVARSSDPPASEPPAPADQAWDEDEERPRRTSGKKVAIGLMVVVVAFSALIVYARKSYRGEHDTADGLALKYVEPSASVAASATPPTPRPAASSEPTPVASAAPVVATVTTSEPVPTPPTTATPTAPASVAVKGPTPPGPTPPGPTPPGPTPVSAASAGGAVGLTEAAQKALEKPEQGAAGRAAELAYKATRQDPGNAEAWLTLGAAYDAIGKRGQALDAYRRCAKQAAGHPRVGECRALAGLD